MMADVGVSISGMPGPPFGPSYRMMITAPYAAAPRPSDKLSQALKAGTSSL